MSAGRGDVGAHALARGHLHGGNHVGVGRVGERHRHFLIVLAQRQRLRLAQELHRQALFHQRQLGIVGRGDGRQPQLQREGIGKVAPRDEPEARQDHADLFPRAGFLHLQGAVEVGGIEFPALDENLAKAPDRERGFMRKHLKSITSHAPLPGGKRGQSTFRWKRGQSTFRRKCTLTPLLAKCTLTPFSPFSKKSGHRWCPQCSASWGKSERFPVCCGTRGAPAAGSPCVSCRPFRRGPRYRGLRARRLRSRACRPSGPRSCRR